MITFDVVSVFPELFSPYMSSSIMGRAQEKGLFSLSCHDLRRWTHDKHRSVDDTPYGGGQGMLMKCAPFYEAFDEITEHSTDAPYIIMFSPAGERFTQKIAEDLATKSHILFACAHYEGVDERVYAACDKVISMGDFILTGAELCAMTVMDSVVRLLPGALGDDMSAKDESFSSTGLLEYAQYTRPQSYRGMDVPAVLLSGHHQKIDEWRAENARERTRLLRPDLLEHAKKCD